MKLSNLRLEKDVTIGGELCTRVICNIEANFTTVKELYFWVDNKYGDMLTYDVYDAFLVAMLYPAMHYKEDIEISGNVSKNLYYNIKNYVMAVISDYALMTKKEFKPVDIKIKGYANALKNERLFVGTGFSGGVDSFSTLLDHYYNENETDYKINSLFFFHVGQYGNVNNPKSWERAKNRFSITSDYAQLINVPAILMNTNLFDFYQQEWEYSGGILIRCASVLIFQKSLRRYYISNAIKYIERASIQSNPNPDMAEFADPILMPLLSPEGIEIIDDGEQYYRSDKVCRIANNKDVQRLLNVCVNTDEAHVEAKNCSECSKCLRTMFTIDIINAFDKFENVFDKSKWDKLAFKYKCESIYLYNKVPFAKDNIDLARKTGYKLPPTIIAYSYIYILKVCHLLKRIFKKISF